MISKLYRLATSLWSSVGRQLGSSGLNSKSFGVDRVLIATGVVTGLLLVVRQLGGMQPLELVAFDGMVRLSPDAGSDPRLLVVAITEQDLLAYEKWPISNGTVARVLAELERHNPAVIGLDLYRDIIGQEPGDRFLQEQLKANNIIAIKKLPDSDIPIGVPPPPGLPEERVGFNDLLLDADGVVRRNLLSISTKDGASYSLSLRVALSYLKDKGISTRPSPSNPYQIQLGKAVFSPLKPNSGGYQNIDTTGYQILLNYRAARDVARQISLADVLNQNFEPSWVKNKIVLIGSTAPSLKDRFFTPYSAGENERVKMPGVLVHANLVSEILSAACGNDQCTAIAEEAATSVRPVLFWFWPEWAEVLWVFFWAMAGGILTWRLEHPLKLGFATAAVLGSLMGLSFSLFLRGAWVPVLTPIVAFVATSGSALSSKLLYNAFHDTLTGLPNRASFAKDLRRLQRRKRFRSRQNRQRGLTGYPEQPDGDLPGDEIEKLAAQKLAAQKLTAQKLAVLLLDLDRFKAVNDALGPELGDRLLIDLASRIRRTLSKNRGSDFADTFARVGVDEFGILLKNIEAGDVAIAIAHQLRRELTLPFYCRGEEIFISATIGIAIGASGSDRNLLRDAQTALYRAKVLRKNAPEVFETTMQERAIEKFRVERDLRRALKEEYAEMVTNPGENNNGENSSNSLISARDSQFIAYYQPIISFATGRIAGFEALVRWQHPERGMVSPGQFIPVSEETGLIIPLGALMLRFACEQVYQWQQQFPNYEEFMITVNLSGKQFDQPDPIGWIEQTLKETGLPPQSLKLEITESMVMDDVKGAIEIMHALKKLNIKLSIDDFGTGYSSLSYLTQFPSDTLKVDRSFVNRMDEDGPAIVETIVSLAHNLNMDVIAEGIETGEQMEQLRSLGCEYGQGFFFERPRPSADIEKLLASDRRWH